MGITETHQGLVNLESQSLPQVIDFIFVPFIALFFPSVRLFLDTYVFEKIATRLMFGKGHGNLEIKSEAKKKTLQKFKESAWKCLYFLSAEFLALYVSYSEPWLRNTKYFWTGPGDQTWPDLEVKLKLKGVYMYATGFYVYSIAALVFWETRRSDFWVSMGHHIVSVSLLVLSYISRFARVGPVVLAVHDGSDVFLEIAKMSKYSGYQGIADIFFILFVLSFTLLRIVCYPLLILRSTSYEILFYIDMEKYAVKGPVYYYIFNILLFSLLVINFYWWSLMVRMAVRLLRPGGELGDDVRSDSEDDDEHDD